MLTWQVLTALMAAPSTLFVLKWVTSRLNSAWASRRASEVEYLRDQVSQQQARCKDCIATQIDRESKLMEMGVRLANYEPVCLDEKTQPGQPSRKRTQR